MTGILRCLQLQVVQKSKAAACVIQPTCQEGKTLGLHGREYSPPVTKEMHVASVGLRCPEIVLEGKSGRSPGLSGQTDQLSQSIFGLCPRSISSLSSLQAASICRFDTHLNSGAKTCLPRQANGFRGPGTRLRQQDASSGFQTLCSACFHTSCGLQGKGSDFVQRHRQGLRGVPLPAMVLGLSGLIPFLVPALYTAATFTVGPSLLWAQVAYGASILSFLGGIRWGFALTVTDGERGPTWSSLGYSVVPSLIAWSGLLMPLQPSQLCIIGGLLIAGAVDAGTNVYPPWFQSLRLLLSLFALLSLGVSYGFCLVYEPTSQAHGSNVYKLIKIVKIILED